MKTFPTWQAAYDWAQAEADRTGLSLGIEKPSPYERGWLVRYLPRPENRYGYDTLCEAVEPSRVRR